MKNFKIVYVNWVDNYFDVENTSLFWGEKFNGTDYKKYIDVSEDFDPEELYKIIKEYRNIIIKDFERYLKYIIPSLKNSDDLAFEMQLVVDTLNNGIDYTIDNDDNFLTLTDEYLYFNNIENAIDDLLLGSLDDDEAFIYKTTVIVKRDYKEFYFITKAINILNTKEKYTVKSFLIDNDRVVGKISEKKIETRSDEYGENDLKKVLIKLGKIEEC